MKYFFTILLSLFLAQPVFAAREVNGSIPQVQPLQPPMVGVSPNVKGNIQASAPSDFRNSSSTGSSETMPGQQANSQNLNSSASSAMQSGKPNIIILIVIILLGLLAVGWVLLKRKKL